MVECHLTNDFGVLVQISLGLLAFISLVYKRQTERPRRQWKIWGLDVSKQGISAVLAHFLNLFLAIIITKNGKGDECIWYFVTFILDTTLGVLICYLMVKWIDDYFEKHNKIYYKTGNYLVAVVLRDIDVNLTQQINHTKQDQNNNKVLDDEDVTMNTKNNKNNNNTNKNNNNDNNNNKNNNNNNNNSLNYEPGSLGAFLRIDSKMWLIQLLIWNLVVIVSKVGLFIFAQLFQSILLPISKTLFSPFQNYPNIELFLIMFFIPTTMNIFYFWIVDNFLKKQQITKIEEQLGIQNQLFEDIQPSQITLVMSDD